MAVDSLRIKSSDFSQNIPLLEFLIFFFFLDWGYMFLKRRAQRRTIPFSSYCIKAACYLHGIAVGVELDRPAEAPFASVLHPKLVSAARLHSELLTGKSLCASRTSGARERQVPAPCGWSSSWIICGSSVRDLSLIPTTHMKTTLVHSFIRSCLYRHRPMCVYFIF